MAPGFWQITETHVHIEGKALFFKNIGQHQDEVQTEFSQVPNGTTLEQAVEMSKALEVRCSAGRVLHGGRPLRGVYTFV